jgi:hypothetical protein
MTNYTKDYVKDPRAVKDYTVDWTNWLGADTIAASTWSSPDGIVNVADSVNAAGTKAVVWLSGGVAPNDYECYNTITTTGGRTERAMIKIQVR